METKVIIFFVGLAVFSSQIPNDLGMKAILPDVTYVDPTTAIHHQVAQLARAEPSRFEQPASPGQGARPAPAPAPGTATAAQRFGGGLLEPFGPQPHVEDHQSVLIFPTATYDPSSSWPKAPLQTDPNYSYVVLSRDHIRFLTQPPAVSPPLVTTGLVLPSLFGLCPGMKPLQKNYLPPYQGAAAVFDLADEGELTSCKSLTKANPPAYRFDSKLVLKTTAQRFVVSASTMTSTKELRLNLSNVNGAVNVYVGNIPKRFLTGDFSEVPSTAINGVSHVRAYYDMGAAASKCAKPLKDWFDNDPAAQTVPDCGFTFTGAGIPPAPGGGNPNVTLALRMARQAQAIPMRVAIPGEIPPAKMGALQSMAMTFECSNSQWP
jgi:hypothetical protein